MKTTDGKEIGIYEKLKAPYGQAVCNQEQRRVEINKADRDQILFASLRS